MQGPWPNNDMFSYSEVNLPVVGTEAAAVMAGVLLRHLEGGIDSMLTAMSVVIVLIEMEAGTKACNYRM